MQPKRRYRAPTAPSNLAGTAASGTQINLTWSDNSDNEESFIIEQSTDGTSFTQIASKSANSTSHSATGLLPATTYTFRIKAVNSAGASAWSAVATAATQSTTAGAISREIWYTIDPAQGCAGIPVNTPPDETAMLFCLQEPSNFADTYGTRNRGFLIAPASGDYVFWICGDDHAQLWLSSDEDPANKTKIAYYSYWTDPLQWNKYSTQKSASIPLVAGKRYYIETLHIDRDVGSDHMAAGWAKPGQSTTAPSEIIPGSVLSLYVGPAAPSALSASTVSSTQIDLAWTDNSDNETGFIIEGSLAGQTFAQLGTAPANATSFAAVNLTPNTQYQFRIKATNYAGSSAYTSTATAVTGQPGDQEGPELSPQLLSFAIYSQDLSLVQDSSAFSGGGAVGSNTLVKIMPYASIYGDVVSGGNVDIRDHVTVNGDVTCAGSLAKVESASISGTVTEGAEVAIVDIPSLSFSYGTTNVTVESGQSLTLQPGSYKNLTVNSGGTITFLPGYYAFKLLNLGPTSTALFNVPINKVIEINVGTSLNLQDGAIAKFPVKGYAPCVKIYTNAYIVDIGYDVQLSGILTAPNAAVHIYSRQSRRSDLCKEPTTGSRGRVCEQLRESQCRR
ncbi:MAG: fibronectin type III domain-containing protein [Chitinispirillaceae bacterium]|nr:fibronectin type III domain-containing protein [Chitinispirillaceae bacterium]